MAEISNLNGYKIKDKKATRFYDDVETMINDSTLKKGMHVKTKGYYSVNDGGSAYYHISDQEDTNIHQEILSNNLYANLIFDHKVNIKQFGAKGDNLSDDINAFKKAIEFCSYNNVELIIPEGTFILNTITSETVNDFNYKYFLKLINNIKITGINKNSVLKIESTDDYTSVFLNNENANNIEIKNITIEQSYLSGNNMSLSDRGNIKCAIVMYGLVSNVKIENVYFKNCCGVNTLAVNNSGSNNVIIKNNIFDYHHVVGVNHYDRSIIYCECHDYLVGNNIVNGNFETLGGIECHGYNGRCENNIINKCYTATHIAPRFEDEIGSANIIVTNNILKDNAIGIKIWENTNSQSTIDCKGITITNNDIKMSGYVFNQNFWLSVGDHRSESLSGITIYEYTTNHKFSDIIIANNSLVVNNYSDYSQYVTVGTAYCNGISIGGSNDVKNLQIINNHIEGWPGGGISTGSFNTAIVKNTENVIITNNTILNVGTGVENQIVYKSPISLKYGVINNMIIRNNNIIKTDPSYNAYVSIYNQTNADSIRTNLYCDHNIIYSVLENQYAITSNSLKNIIIDRGVTADRPINANKGDSYYDTTLNKLIIFNGSNWINVDGTSLS